MESYPSLRTPLTEQINAMYNEGASEFIDQGLYYPTAANYGYYCTGFESPGEWEDHNKIIGIDGPDIQYAGPQTESCSYVYYTPSYGCAESPYNPYNPYIPGAMIGADSPFIGPQHYYTIPHFQEPGSSPAYVPVVIPHDILSNGFPDPFLNIGTSIANRPNGRGLNQNTNPPKPALNQKRSSTRILEGLRAKSSTGPSNQLVINGSVPSGSTAGSSHVLKDRNPGFIQQPDNISSGKVLSHRNQVNVALPDGNGFSDFRSSAHGRSAVDKLHAKGGVGQAPNNASGNPGIFTRIEQNQAPRTNKSKDQLAVKAYTTKAGINDAQGNIIIHTDRYNKEDFQVDYVDAKFFVIKSYSEDDVHKSVKYGVWSSTSHGNKKLQSAYEDVQKLAVGKLRGCPIFLFFSVNASSQFCGVAEMIGPVDFYKDMDFWQQDKWSGSFPVKWYIIKDVPNTCFRHIILENNDNKPVTNSRDTQEIIFKEGLEMLKIFKNHPLDTSLFDDFLFYEKCQKFIEDEKARVLFQSFQDPYFVPVLELADKLNQVVELPSKEDKEINKNSDPNCLEGTLTSATKKIFLNSDVTNCTGNENAKHAEVKDDITPTLSTDSLALSPKPAESKPLAEAIPVAKSESRDVFTVGSMPIKVNRFSESSCILTVGTIPLDPKALQLDEGDAFPKTLTHN